MTDKRNLLLLLLQAACVSLVLNAPVLFEYASSAGTSLDVFSDPDEALYLQVALDYGSYFPYAAIHKEHAVAIPLAELLTHWRPDYGISHFLFGYAARLAGLGILEFGLMLDLLVVMGIYFFMNCFLNQLFPNRTLIAAVGSLLFIAFPWMLSFENYFGAEPQWHERIFSLPFLSHTALGALEGLGTQLAVLSFPLILILFYRCTSSEKFSPQSAILCGAVTGLSVYVYVLGWMAISTIIGIAFLLLLCLHGFERRRALDLAFYCLSNILISIPAMLQTAALRSRTTLFPDATEVYREAIYFSVFWAVAAALLLFFVYRSRSDKKNVPLVILVSAIVAEFVLHNLQPLTGVVTQSLFMSLYFTRPLITAVGIAYLLNLFRQDRIIQKGVKIVLVVLILAAPLSRERERRVRPTNTESRSALIAYLKSEIPSGSVIAALPYKPAFRAETRDWDWYWIPRGIATISGHYLLSESWGLQWGGLSAEENFRRELGTGTLFTGSPQLLRACEFELVKEKMMFVQQWIAVQLARLENCKNHRALLESYSACESVEDFQIDYLLWEHSQGLERPAHISNTMTEVWQSADKELTLYKINKNSLRKHFCHESPIQDS